MGNKGFTLVELLVTISLLGLVTAMSIPRIIDISENSRESKHKKYGDSIVSGAKLYVDSYSSDMFGNSNYGCKDISIEELKSKLLAKDINIDDETCLNNETYVRVIKLNNKYQYQLSLECTTSDKKTNYTHYASGEITGEVTNQTREQMDENIKAYASGACTHIEKTAIAQYFYEYDFSAIKTFRGSGIFKYNNEDIELSNDCAKEAEDLYNSLIILRETLSDYADTGGDVNTINFLSLQSSYFAGYGSLTTQWYDNKTTDDVCSAISDDIRNVLNEFFNTFRLVCVILTIFMVYLDGMKCLAKKDDSETKKWITKSGKRLVMLVGALMLPLLVDFILNFIDKTMEGSYVRVNGECVKAITGGTK